MANSAILPCCRLLAFSSSIEIQSFQYSPERSSEARGLQWEMMQVMCKHRSN
ncbi:hypothetical protein PISMIDRAFT_689055 [Pisolithus microcarpus 441]|uniref:Unplaced genomic scaffold scaffold_343, whole genome shotgun sequence n=1 Tax=Pisolithus microcarpus 441 TaxID=765257 RepID=A0A0C9YYU6_9AGAM|nr:hypothetical protein PISMIDRAFT_689055 [Pisolithus microcarpus 441]